MTQSTRIILLAHGSTDPNWQQTFDSLAAPALTHSRHAVLAHMELCEPSLETAVAEAAESGYTHVKIIPLFLARGRHLRKDVPGMIEDMESRYPVTIELTRPVGEHPALADTIGQIVEEYLSNG